MSPGPPRPGDPRPPGTPAFAPDPRRVAEGWERRFVADEARAAEMMRLYEELGFETVADPIRTEDVSDACGDCRLVAALRFKMIYTRRRTASSGTGRALEDAS